MQIGVLGTGEVGRTLGGKLVELGHEVCMGSRSATNAAATTWAEGAGPQASRGTFADAAAFGEVILNCTSGMGSLEALAAAGAANLAGKALIDVANPLDFSSGELRLTISNTDSLGEAIQRAFPEARVVKALNTVNSDVMVSPGIAPGDHVTFVCGNDAQAKAETARLLGELGWPAARVIDLGDITASRGLEMYLPLWLRLMNATGTAHFNIALSVEGR